MSKRVEKARTVHSQKSEKKIFSSAEMILVRKDLGSFWAKNSFRALLMLLPIMLAVVIPVVYFVAICLLPVEKGARFPEMILNLLPDYAKELDYRQAWTVAFTDLLCPLLILCVPILTAAASASYAFVTERERGTLEALLLTPLDAKSIFHAKVIGCTILSVLISAAAFVMFFITVFVADLFAGVPLFFSFDWLVLFFLFMPALSFFSVNFIALIIARVHSTGESLQTMGYLILPVVVLYLAQFTGIFRMNFLVLIIVAVILGGADLVLYNFAARSFTPEKLVDEIRAE